LVDVFDESYGVGPCVQEVGVVDAVLWGDFRISTTSRFALTLGLIVKEALTKPASVSRVRPVLYRR